MLVGEVEKYPEFLPWCVAARIIEGDPAPMDGKDMLAELVVRFKLFQESYVSRVTFHPGTAPDSEHAILVDLERGPFKHLENRWKFIPENNGTRIQFHITFQFATPLLEKLAGALFHKAAQKMIAAFETRAHATLQRN